MNGITEVVALDKTSFTAADKTVLRILLSKTDVHLESGLLDKELQQCHIEIYQLFRHAVQNLKEFVLVVLEIGRGPVCRHNRSLVLLKPRSGIINLYILDRMFVCSAFMDHGERKGLDTIGRIETAAVAIGLLLIVFAGLDIYDRRRQFT